MAYKVLTNENFESELKNSPKAVIDFYADWCGPCKMFAPTFEKVSGEVDGVAFFKVNVDQAEKAAEEYGIMSIPTTVYAVNGEEKDRSTGAMSEEGFKEEIKAKLG